MSGITWIKLTTNMFEDDKIKLIEAMPDSDSLLIIWIKLLTLAGRINRGGLICITDTIPYTEEELSAVMNRPLQTVKLAMAVFIRFGMVELLNGCFYITNWEKHQNIEALEQKRLQDAARQRRHRAKRKLLAPVTDMSRDCHNEITQQNKNKNIDKEYILYIYSLWNEQKIIEHKELTPAIKSSIEKILKDYSGEDVEQSIKNYATILKSPDYYFKYKWTLQEFLTRNKGNNIERFLDIETAKANFKRDANNGNGKDKWTGLPGNKPTGAFDFIDQQ